MNFLNLLLLFGLAGRSLCGEKPTIYDLTLGSKLVENKKFFLVCSLSAAEPDATFEWLLNGKKLTSNENVYMSQQEESSMLNVRSMSLELVGEFECRVSNRFGQDSRSIAVKLEGENRYSITLFALISIFLWISKF